MFNKNMARYKCSLIGQHKLKPTSVKIKNGCKRNKTINDSPHCSFENKVAV